MAREAPADGGRCGFGACKFVRFLTGAVWHMGVQVYPLPDGRGSVRGRRPRRCSFDVICGLGGRRLGGGRWRRAGVR
jgi:hypothetical protein